jgi:radical SAM superfamily enzyme YgiQ (UPF0313 family)
MKILLINPPIENMISSNVPHILEEDDGFIPPLGLMYIAAYLEKNTEHQVEIIDCLPEKIDHNQLAEKIRLAQPDVIGITALTFALIDVIAVIKAAKKINPAIITILGGPHVNIYPDETLNIPEVDFVVLGEGEMPCLDLINNLNDLEKLKTIQGLAFRDENGKICNTGARPLLQNLDDIPFPARHLTPYQKYYSVLSKEFPVTSMFTSRGCPYKCLFCDRPHLGKQFRARSAQSVIAEIKECIRLGIKEIFIYDDTFTVDRQRVVDICQGILKENLNIKWDVRARVNTVDEELLKLMSKAGCIRIHYGVEAGTKRILEVLRKGITLEMAKKAFALTKKSKIITLAYFMFGAPTETKKEALQTIKFAKKLKADYAHFAILTPFPATDAYFLGLQQGVLTKDYWLEFAKNPTPDFKPAFWEKEMNREELVKLLKKAYFSFYFRPGFILKQIVNLKSPTEFIRKFKLGLGLLKYKLGLSK